MSMTDARRCAFSPCGPRNPETGERLPRLARDGSWLCGYHEAQLSSDLDDIPTLFAVLPDLLDASSQRAPDGSGIKARRAAAPTPARLDIVALLDWRTTAASTDDLVDVAGVLADWRWAIERRRGITHQGVRIFRVSRRGEVTVDDPYRIVSSSVIFLARHLPWSIAQPWVGDMAVAIHAVREQIARATGLTDPAPLGRCHLPHRSHPDRLCGGDITVTQDPAGVGDEAVGSLDVLACRRCGETWATPDERARLTLILDSTRLARG